MMGKRLLVVTGTFLILFFGVSAVLSCEVTDPLYSQAASEQQNTDIMLDTGRGNIYDCNFLPLTGKYSKQYVLAEPGKTSYRTMFELVHPELRTEFYSGIQTAKPFLVPLNSDSDELPEYVFKKTCRYLPYPAAVHLVGYLDESGHGATGLERAFDSLLEEGGTCTQVHCSANARGRILRKEPVYLLENTGKGTGIATTINLKLQRACESIANCEMEKGCIVVMDSASGRLKACACVPAFNPEFIGESIRKKDSSLVSRVISAYNVGSVFKPLIAAAALESGISPNEQYHCSGSIKIGDHIFHCAHGRGHGNVDMKKALSESCNCYFIQLGMRLGGEKIYKTAMASGFGRRINLGGGFYTSKGNFPQPEELKKQGALASVSFGQGTLTASPLQITAMMNIFANGGRYIEPVLTEGIVDEYTRTVKQSLYCPFQMDVFHLHTAETIRKMLIDVVENGLGKNAAPRAGKAGGKTGTAQTGRYTENDEEILDAWFSGFYPAEKPEYTITVLLDSGTHGSDDAAHIFAKICDAICFFEGRNQDESLSANSVNSLTIP